MFKYLFQRTKYVKLNCSMKHLNETSGVIEFGPVRREYLYGFMKLNNPYPRRPRPRCPGQSCKMLTL